MNLTVQRKTLTSKSTIGQLYLDGTFQCYTLEPPAREDKPHSIPAGTYQLSFRWSPKFLQIMPHVENVPGFEEIELHWGNYPSDTEGCLILGQTVGPDFVGLSKAAFAKLFTPAITGTITYLDPSDSSSPSRPDSA